MPSTVEQISPTRAKLVIELPFSELEPSIEKAYQQIASQVNIPGFRKGKVPPRLIDQRFGRGAVLQEAINDYLPTAYAKAVDETKIYPLGQPEIDINELEDGDKIVFSAEVDIRPEFDLPSYDSIEIEVEKADDNDEESVNAQLENMRNQFATYNELDRAAAKDDFVVFDLSASKDGEALPDAEAKDMQYKIGAGGLVDGIDDALIGMNIGDSKIFTSKLVGGELKDVEAEIQVTLNKVMEQQLPEINDEFAQLVSEFDTVEEMMDGLRDTVARANRLQQANDARELAIEQLVAKTEFELPEKLLQAERDARHQSIEAQLQQANLTLEKYLSENPAEPDSAEEFWASIDERAEQGIRAQVILDKVAEDTQIQVSQEELMNLIFQKAQASGNSPDQEIKHMMEHNHMAEWMAELRRGKALGQIVAEITIKDSDGKIVDLTNLNADGTIAEPEDVAEQETKDEAVDAEPVAEKPKPKKAAAKKTTKKSEKAEEVAES